MRSFLAMGGGVGLGTLGITHGLGPEPAGPPPPPPTVISGPADEREAIWERKRQVLRDWDQQQGYWRSQQTVADQYAQVRAELERAGAEAAAEQRRIRAADLLHRFQPVGDQPPEWLPPNQRQRWSTGSTAAQVTPVESIPPEHAIERVRVLDGTEVEPSSPPADYAILPLGDHATIEALADGTLEVFVDPLTGIRAVLETEDGQKFVYGRIGSVAKRRVKAGETIGFTPYARKADVPAAGEEPPMPPMEGGQPPTGELPQAPIPAWPSERRQPVAARAARAGGGAPPNNVVPLRRPAPGPAPRESRGMGALLLLGLGVALLASGGKGRR